MYNSDDAGSSFLSYSTFTPTVNIANRFFTDEIVLDMTSVATDHSLFTTQTSRIYWNRVKVDGNNLLLSFDLKVDYTNIA